MSKNLKTYIGGCRCGQVRYQVELALQAGSSNSDRSGRGQSSYWGALVKPGAFKLLAGEDSLCDYTINSRSVHHLVCKHCGIRTFCRGDIPEIGGPYVTVNLKCLDELKCPDGVSDCV